MTDALAHDPSQMLVLRAREALQHAYAPYSRFRVAAAVQDDQGRVFTGVNVENASYGLTLCAERVAIGSAIAAGARAISALAVTAAVQQPITPCGACRQVMAEFCAPSTPIYCDHWGAAPQQTCMSDLLPQAFGRDDLRSE